MTRSILPMFTFYMKQNGCPKDLCAKAPNVREDSTIKVSHLRECGDTTYIYISYIRQNSKKIIKQESSET